MKGCSRSAALAEPANAIPSVRQGITTYDQFARSQLNEIYGEEALRQAGQLEVRELHHGILLNDGGGRFDFLPLPIEAQFSSAQGVQVQDYNRDKLARPDPDAELLWASARNRADQWWTWCAAAR